MAKVWTGVLVHAFVTARSFVFVLKERCQLEKATQLVFEAKEGRRGVLLQNKEGQFK